MIEHIVVYYRQRLRVTEVTTLERGSQPRGSKKGSGLAHQSHEGIPTGNALFYGFVKVEVFVTE